VAGEEPEESSSAETVPSGNGSPEGLRGAIEVEGLRFAYAGGDDVLHDISFSIEPGRSLALLGPPGSGKSSIVQLLLRLYDYEHGSIRLDGTELSELPRRFVRSQIGVVLQEPFLYSKTLEANVGVGRREATRDEIVESTQAACIHGAIEDFEHGYDTLVGERGVTLSGGQRQRLALARALVKDPPILVLDDALSAVDTGTESRILSELERRRGNATTIIIAHRLSSVRHADRIVVLENGKIEQAGSHEELLRAEGMYRRLWTIQGAMEDEIEEDLSSIEGAAS
jgi:ATP-binding cassette subfamily B protein